MYTNVFSKGYTEKLSKLFSINLVLETNSWRYKVKYLNGEKWLSFYKK